MDAVFRALSDATRRSLLDRLFADGGQSLGSLAHGLSMSRQAVAKHLAILEEANLVVTRRSGREKLHWLNPVPIGEIVKRWVGKFEDARIEALCDFAQEIEGKENQDVRRRA
jgi:DNA-binding transcriptional ArsR family regulator